MGGIPAAFDPMKQFQIATGQYKWNTNEGNAAQANVEKGHIFDRESLSGYGRMMAEAVGGDKLARYQDSNLSQWTGPTKSDQVVDDQRQAAAMGAPTTGAPATPLWQFGQAPQQPNTDKQLGALIGSLVQGQGTQ